MSKLNKLPLSESEYLHILNVVKDVYHAGKKLQGLLDGDKKSMTKEQMMGISKIKHSIPCDYNSDVCDFESEIIKATS